MPSGKGVVISAQVIFRSASGHTMGTEAISSDNVADFAPSATAIESVANELRFRGFEIGPFVGISFSITGKLSLFEEFFGMQVQMGNKHACEFIAKGNVPKHELSGAELPEVIRKFVQAVVFPLPPEFGPTEFKV